MICRYCKKETPDCSIYCCMCGEKQKKERRKNNDVKIPEPRQLPSGRWRIVLAAEKMSITRDTADECRTEAKSVRLGLIESHSTTNISLYTALDDYIAAKSNILSPSTIRGYKMIQAHRFIDVQDRPIVKVDWQKAVNKESALCSAKTLKNAWGVCASAMRAAGIPAPAVTLPQIIKNERSFLEPEEIPKFIAAIKDTASAVPALLALHSLRRSEIYGLTEQDVDLESGIIHVRGACVQDPDSHLVYKKTNKNQTSRRDIPIFIPELRELLAAGAELHPYTPDGSYRQINRICRENGLPEVGLHGLRHSFVSLCFSRGINEMVCMQLGGWNDFSTMRKIYTHLSRKDLSDSIDSLEKFFTSV